MYTRWSTNKYTQISTISTVEALVSLTFAMLFIWPMIGILAPFDVETIEICIYIYSCITQHAFHSLQYTQYIPSIQNQNKIHSIVRYWKLFFSIFFYSFYLLFSIIYIFDVVLSMKCLAVTWHWLMLIGSIGVAVATSDGPTDASMRKKIIEAYAPNQYHTNRLLHSVVPHPPTSPLYASKPKQSTSPAHRIFMFVFFF